MPYTVPILRTVRVDRYVLPLREGGSLPGLVEADDDFKYVLKFKGAAQGPKVLISELIGGEIARAIGLKMPELVFAELDEAYGRTELDQEIQGQLKASTGLNMALSYLSGSIMYDPGVTTVNPELASLIVWLDCLITNPDRTANNPNMLMWYRELWVIDHGAAMYFHYNWSGTPAEMALRPFDRVKQHVLLTQATLLTEVGERCVAILTEDVISDIVSQIPDAWLVTDSPFTTAEEHRDAYKQYLLARIEHSKEFIKEADYARKESL